MQPASLAMVQPGLRADQAVLFELKEHIGERSFGHWFDKKTILTVVDDELIIGVGSPFLLTWMQKQFRLAALKSAQAVLGPSARLRFEVNASLSVVRTQPDAETTAANEVPRRTAEPRKGVTQSNESVATASDGRALRPGSPRTSPQQSSERKSSAQRTTQPASGPGSGGRRFASMTDFVIGQGNELAVTAARQVCEAPGQRFNPLFIHGGVGIGKTHLLEAIYGQMRRAYPSLHVMFLTSEAFANYFTKALRDHTLPSFRQRFRNVDVLLVDDIDFLDSKRVIQEEFLHTFKQLESHGRQIVLTSDRHPRLLSKVSDELSTRFLSGLVCRIENPDLPTRLRIVEHKSTRMDAEFSPEALTFIAQRFKNNVRELEGALNCLQTYHAMTKKRIGVTAARNVLADLERDCIRIVRITDVETAICALFRVQPDELKSSKRSRIVSQPRMLAMFLARKHTGAAYSEIGAYFGGRNHSTVMSAEKKVQSWLDDHVPISIASQTWTLDDILETVEQQLVAG